MGRTVRWLGAVAAAGTVALSGAGVAAATPAPAVSGYYTGFGSGSSQQLALWSAQDQAYWKASIGGFRRFDCRVTYSNVTGGPYSYSAYVNLYCWRP
ncbi:hypothetical protein EV193_101184 [Herbihabitans rhizosphaerae]|uniref:Lactococcin 972 family bacteriocin n=1 Tax=Herbihabitans rhizosphaerae TaxID=1872711 RepID=A0A4Q7L3W7_9PSEU|nr:hypothetical protein [Herbihabitans rhizosphaerae]RZS44309.1 hypothetical protein EV193_101184 [Herbihabitans rhizosphaerae]